MILSGLVAAVMCLSPNGEMDMTAAFMNAVESIRKSGGGEVTLKPGVYHFRTPRAMRFYVSNHDNPMPRNVFLPIVGVTNLQVVCRGRAEFVFHGEGIGLALQDAKDARLQGIGVDWQRPYFSEVTVDQVDADGRIVIAADPEQFPFELNEKGVLTAVGEGWKKTPALFEAFDGVRRSYKGALWIGYRAEALGGNRFRLMQDFSKARFTTPLAKGDFATVRSAWRPNPAVLLYRARQTTLEDCAVHSSAGMGLIAQRCEDVTIRGSGPAASARAGSFPRAGTGRRLSLQADATHFSNCKGRIVVENCLFEGMNDDAINVHSTCLRIERICSRSRILCAYRHVQSVGFEVFLPGERLRAIKGRTMEPADGLVEVSGVEMQSADRVLISLSAELPDGVGVGDAVENADWQPAVVFRNNIVRNSSPRATLFTTPGKVVCEGNLFEHIAAQAVHMAGDTWDWYESGGCRDVTIRGNVFRDVCICGGKGVIQIDPNVGDIGGQKMRYHRNVLVESNVFEQVRTPLLYARSVSNLVWRSNVGAAAAGFDVRHCDDMRGVPCRREERAR